MHMWYIIFFPLLRPLLSVLGSRMSQQKKEPNGCATRSNFPPNQSRAVAVIIPPVCLAVPFPFFKCWLCVSNPFSPFASLSASVCECHHPGTETGGTYAYKLFWEIQGNLHPTPCPHTSEQLEPWSSSTHRGWMPTITLCRYDPLWMRH